MTLIDGFRSHHGTFTDELHIIEITVHVDAVHHQMQVGNATFGVTVKGGKILRIGDVGRLDRSCSLVLLLPDVVHLGDAIHLTDELVKESPPVFHRPVPCLLLRWGKLKADGRQFDGLLGIPLLEHGLMQHHFVPHAHRRQTLVKKVGLDDVRTVVLGCVIGHCLPMLNC